MPRTDLDPNARFDWPESSPATASTCKPGRYVGTFECTYVQDAMNPGLFPIVPTGQVELQLERSVDGEFLEIRDGKLNGVAEGIIGFTSKLAGRLDCSTLQLKANAHEGLWAYGDPSILPVGTFEGTLDGKLDGATATLAGSWSLTINLGGSCNGTWTTSFTP